MRIVVSGTHASGKSSLIDDFVRANPEYEVLPDPFDALADQALEVDAGLFYSQLVIAADRLRGRRRGDRVIAERGPIDFLAYLHALRDLGRPSRSAGYIERGAVTTAQAMTSVDFLVLLPLQHRDPITVSADEDRELRAATDAALLDLVDDPDLMGSTRVVEVTGRPDERLSRLCAALSPPESP